MKILALDPGNIETAYCLYEHEGDKVIKAAKVKNEEMLEILQEYKDSGEVDIMITERIACYGMAVGASVFSTCIWIGRFIQLWDPLKQEGLFRREVKMHLCNTTRAKDKNVNRVLLDRFGDWTHGKTGKGTSAHPSQLYGFNNDMFAALGVAVTYAETRLN
jgi:hypothetical protein